MLYQVGHAFQQLVDFILPPRCVCCDNVGQLFCDNCQKNIVWMKLSACMHCGQPIRKASKLCDACKDSPQSHVSIRAATLFQESIIDVIHQFKYYNAFGLARPLAEIMVSGWHDGQAADDHIDVVVSIPLHETRLQERGYNQSALLATHFAQLVGFSCNNHLLQRTRHTSPQARLSGAERAKNVQHAFALFRGDAINKHVLLIDDVCTTGATIFSAAETLLAAGARQVSAYCLARAA